MTVRDDHWRDPGERHQAAHPVEVFHEPPAPLPASVWNLDHLWIGDAGSAAVELLWPVMQQTGIYRLCLRGHEGETIDPRLGERVRNYRSRLPRLDGISLWGRCDQHGGGRDEPTDPELVAAVVREAMSVAGSRDYCANIEILWGRAQTARFVTLASLTGSDWSASSYPGCDLIGHDVLIANGCRAMLGQPFTTDAAGRAEPEGLSIEQLDQWALGAGYPRSRPLTGVFESPSTGRPPDAEAQRARLADRARHMYLTEQAFDGRYQWPAWHR